MKIVLAMLGLFFPFLVFADSSLSLTPPSTDYSVVFLGNMFGVVDGVLHGNGSQLMGKMFGVFNAAVLALGGIVVTYTLIVGTMNTSHEGQFLGQKWSSIWIPVRSTIGLALLIPKTSGYCLMQIFIMWLVVQGVGAADRVWDAALSYLNLGGVIVGAQSNPNPTTSNNSAIQTIATGESRILMGQVCMRGLQTALENVRTQYLSDKNSGSGPCLDSKATGSMKEFCNKSVPDFFSTVDAAAANNKGNNFVNMPNFNTSGMYDSLNGVCGIIKWNKLSVSTSLASVSAEDIQTLNQSRAVAVQQMFMDLSPVAIAMINNDPQLSTTNTSNVDDRYTSVAQNQFGIPISTTSQTACDSPSNDCTNWDAAPGSTNQVMIFTGLEFMNALTDYNAIMAPALNLQSQASNSANTNSYHDFISGAESSGWIMAGTYFFDLANLNGSAAAKAGSVDNDSGLDATPDFSVTTSNLTDPFTNPGSGTYSILYDLFNQSETNITNLINLITAKNIDTSLTPNVGASQHSAVISTASASVYGYVTNASMIHLPGQPGLTTPTFKFNLNMSPGSTIMTIPSMHFGCGFKILTKCVGGPLGKLLWNSLISNFFSIFITFITNLFDMVIQLLLIAPLTVMMSILNDGVQMLNTSQAHPIIAMAYMGTSFINYTIETYFQLVAISALFSFGGGIILIIILPFLGAFLAVMFTAGFIDAYYVPFLPYMIFTFGSIAWFMAVIEAMVAGPIIALGITHPEGHDALGKAEQALTILINVFLRPALMVIGYVAAIALCYVGVYIVNSGFSHVLQFLMPGNNIDPNVQNGATSPSQASTPYISYASMFAGFFSLLAYTTIYLTVVEKSFQLIYLLPDNISRWMGGQSESYGKETAGWADATKEKIKEGGELVGKTATNLSKQVGQKAVEGMKGVGGGKGGDMKME